MDKKTNNWQIKKLGEVCSIQTGKYDANHANSNGKYRFYTCAFDYLYCDTNRFKGQSIILPGNGANVGEVFYYNGDFDAYQRTYVLNEIKTDAKYLFYHLLGNWKNRNKDKQFGSATNYIRMANFTDYEIPIPPLETQHAIVSKIEELFSELDKGIAELKTAQQQLKTYRQSVLKSAFEGKERVLFENIIESSQNGLSKRSGSDGEDLNVLRLADIKNNCIVLDNPRKIKMTSSEIIKYKLNEEDLVCIRVNGSKDLVGKIIYVTKNDIKNKLAFCDHFIRFTIKENINSKFIYYYFQTMEVRKFIHDNMVTSAGQNTVSQVTIKNILVPDCNIEEQHRIVQEIESRLSVADKMEQSIQESLQKAEALRQSILKKAFCGELV